MATGVNRTQQTMNLTSALPNEITKFVAVMSLPDGSRAVMLASRYGEMCHQPYLKRKNDMTNRFCGNNPYKSTRETAIIA